MPSIPSDPELYDKVKKAIYKKYPTHSAYRSGHLVKEYKARFAKKHGTRKQPYKGRSKAGLKRWFKERWVNQRGEVGYKHKSDVYRPTIKVSKKTPKTFSELSKKEISKARRTKARKGRVRRF